MRKFSLVACLAITVSGCSGTGPTPGASSTITPTPSASPTEGQPSSTASKTSTPSATAPAPASPSAQPEPDVTVGEWRRVEDPTFEQAQMFYPMTWSGAQFILPGVTKEGDGVAFWTSTDGETWSMGADRTWGYVSDYAFDGTGAGVAVGWLQDHADVWLSADGVKWTKLADQEAFLPEPDAISVRLVSVAHGEVGYVALGLVNWRAGVNRPEVTIMGSDDGRTWSLRPAETFAGAELAGIEGLQGNYVIAGTADMYTSTPQAAIWASADGRIWSETTMSGPYANVMASGPAGVLVGGSLPGSASANPGDAGRHWWTADGQEWIAIEGVVLTRPLMYALPFGFLAVAFGTCPSSLMAFEGGGPWACVAASGPLPGGYGTASGQPAAYLDSIAVSGTAIVASVRRDGIPEVWVAGLN